MQWYHYTLLAMAISAGVISWKIPRAVLWLSLGALSFVLSVIWHRSGLPGGLIFGAVTNFIICVCLSCVPKRMAWETGFFNAVIMMMMLDALRAWGFIASHEAFAIGLEIVNAVAILIIAAPGASEWVAKYGYFRPGDRSFADRSHKALFAHKPQRPTWWKET